jgi:class 3 adenylate cyclase
MIAPIPALLYTVLNCLNYQLDEATLAVDRKRNYSYQMGNFARKAGSWFILTLFFGSSLMVLFITAVVSASVNSYVAMITESTQNHLITAAQAAAKLVSAEELDQFHSAADAKNSRYHEIKRKLAGFAEEYHVLYAYYWRAFGEGSLQYIVDNDNNPATQVGPENIYEIDETALDALAGNIGVTDLGNYTPKWDSLITAYAPVYDKDGNIYCVAGVDISDDFIFTQRRYSINMTVLQIMALAVSVIFAVLNMLLYRQKTLQIEAAHLKLQYFNNSLRRAFSTYLSEEVVEEIVLDPARLQLGGVKKHMTALFTDIKKFTRIAEALSPEQVVDILNYYLSIMSDIILEQKGTIDKYKGDAIVSFFGAPVDLSDHAVRACVSAVCMKRIEQEVNSHITEKMLCPLPLHTRIGINTGEMVVGNMGTQKKMNYTIISSAVNFASLLEEVNKQYGTWILASEDTVKETEGLFLSRRLDRIRAIGMEEPVRIYEILETTADAAPALHELTGLFQAALCIFETRDWERAEDAFARILETYPDDGPALLYLNRCQQYRQYPPKESWDGAFDIIER